MITFKTRGNRVNAKKRKDTANVVSSYELKNMFVWSLLIEMGRNILQANKARLNI